MSRTDDWAIAQSAATLSRQLRGLGVPLPELVVDGSDEPEPYLILERLEGSDLGAVADTLPADALRLIARRIADAQAIVANLPSAGRYGYADEPGRAPFGRWSEVVEAHLGRSRSRIRAADLFPEAAVDRLAAHLDQLRPDLDRVAATPFLHDTTTKNVIVGPDGRFHGIVDVDDLCWGDPRFAPALTLASFLARDAEDVGRTYVDAWLAHAGWTDDALFRFYVAEFLCDFMGEHGAAFNGPPGYSDPTVRDRLTGAFGAALSRI